jgi:hypothetical protein
MSLFSRAYFWGHLKWKTSHNHRSSSRLYWLSWSECKRIKISKHVLINKNTGTSGTTTFIVSICGLHVSTHTQVILRPSCTCKSIKSYARWDPRRAWRWPVYRLKHVAHRCKQTLLCLTYQCSYLLILSKHIVMYSIKKHVLR